MSNSNHTSMSNNDNNNNQQSYVPLCFVVIAAAILGAIQTYTMHNLHFHSWMNFFMGYFLILIAMPKLFSVSLFGATYKKYDLLSQYIPLYSYAYPIIEFFLGALFINSIQPLIANIVMVIVMISSLVGTVIVLKRGDQIACACMGQSLTVPLGPVSIAESGIMIIMGIMNLLML